MPDRYRPSIVPKLEDLPRYLRTELERIGQSIDAVTNYVNELVRQIKLQVVFAGYGGIRISASTNLPDIDAGWVTIPFDAAEIGVPVSMTYDLPTFSLAFDTPGVWSVAINLDVIHDEVNAGREVFMRLLNTSSATPSGTWRYTTGRNNSGTSMILTSLVEIDETQLGQFYQVQIGGGDDYSPAGINNSFFSASRVSAYAD